MVGMEYVSKPIYVLYCSSSQSLSLMRGETIFKIFCIAVYLNQIRISDIIESLKDVSFY